MSEYPASPRLVLVFALLEFAERARSEHPAESMPPSKAGKWQDAKSLCQAHQDAISTTSVDEAEALLDRAAGHFSRFFLDGEETKCRVVAPPRPTAGLAVKLQFFFSSSSTKLQARLPAPPPCLLPQRRPSRRRGALARSVGPGTFARGVRSGGSRLAAHTCARGHAS